MSELPTPEIPDEGASTPSLTLQCPHCHCDVVVDPEPDNQVSCSSCGNGFEVDPFQTRPWAAGERPTLGKFTLHEIVGRGAFGTVYRALDRELDRFVAVKIPRSGAFQSKEDEDRFVREARNTAQLKHPSIVSVFEVGRSDEYAFIVSEFVQGSTLADVLTARRFSAPQAASLMVEIAAALEHAHQQGVVHRDLKPSNIMLERRTLDTGSTLDANGSTEKPRSTMSQRPGRADTGYRPRVMDFGLARRDDGDVTMTIEGQILGTPAYMSPEQAMGKGHAANACSDVYSLGVILFELLTGELPFRGNKRMLLDQVILDDPPPPRRLDASIPADLETICLRCLEKSPARRFETANELGLELSRYLRGESILSRPITRLERIWRWSVRHRVVAATSAAFAAVVVTAFVLVMVSRANEHHARLEAEHARTLVQKHLNNSVDLVHRKSKIVADSRRPTVSPVEESPEDLREVIQFYENLLAESPDDLDVQSKQGAAYGRLARKLTEIGRLEEANDAYANAHKILGKFKIEDAKQSQLENLGTTLLNFGVIRRSQGDVVESETMYRQAIEIYQRLTSQFPAQKLEYEGTLAGLYMNLANLISDIPRYDDAEREYIRALEIFERLSSGSTDQQVNVAMVKNNLAVLYKQTKRLELARLTYREAIELRRAVAEANPDVQDAQDQLAASLHNLGILEMQMGHYKEAETLLNEGRDIRLRLVSELVTTSKFQSGADKINRRLAGLYAATERIDKATALYTEVIERYRKLIAMNPGVAEYQFELAQQYRDISSLHYNAGELELCLEANREADRLLTALASAHPAATKFRDSLAKTKLNVVLLLRGMKRIEEAVELSRANVELLQQLGQTTPTAESRMDLAVMHQVLAELLHETKQVVASLTSFTAAESILSELAMESDNNNNRQVVAQLVDCMSRRIDVLSELGQNEQAIASWQRLLDRVSIRQRASVRLRRAIFLARNGHHVQAAAEAAELAETPDVTADFLYNLACVYAQAAKSVDGDAAAAAEPSPELASQYQEQAISLLQRAVAAGFTDGDALLADTDLEPLREAAAFKKLITDLKTAP